MRILLIEDNDDLAGNIGDYLEEAGMIVDYAHDGVTGLALVRRERPDVVVLDISLPRLDGLAVARKLRDEDGNDVPILMLTARDALNDKVEGFDAGADDYLTKPFELLELRARVLALARRRQRPGRVLRVGDLSLDAETGEARRGERRLKLTPLRLTLLETLLRRSPATVPHRQLEEALWGNEQPESEGALRVHLHALRHEVDGPGEAKLVITEPGKGYRISENG